MFRPELIHGDATSWRGEADLVFTHPYAPLPSQLLAIPTIVNLHRGRGKERAEAWVGGELTPIGRWHLNRVYVTRLPVRPVFLEGLTPVLGVYEGGGCFPEALVRRVLEAYRDLMPKGAVIWDGFMGRGTVGKVAVEMGYRFIGIDRRLERVRIAKEYFAA